MLILWIGIITMIIVFILSCIDCGFDGALLIIAPAIGFAASIISTLLILGIIFGAACCGADLQVTSETKTELVALKDNFNMESNYYLFRSHGEEKLKYSYLFYVKDKGIIAGQVDADTAYLSYIKDNEKPYLMKRIYNFKNPVLRYLSKVYGDIKTEYSIYVPDGSITVENQYEVNLE